MNHKIEEIGLKELKVLIAKNLNITILITAIIVIITIYYILTFQVKYEAVSVIKLGEINFVKPADQIKINDDMLKNLTALAMLKNFYDENIIKKCNFDTSNQSLNQKIKINQLYSGISPIIELRVSGKTSEDSKLCNELIIQKIKDYHNGQLKKFGELRQKLEKKYIEVGNDLTEKYLKKESTITNEIIKAHITLQTIFNQELTVISETEIAVPTYINITERSTLQNITLLILSLITGLMISLLFIIIKTTIKNK